MCGIGRLKETSSYTIFVGVLLQIPTTPQVNRCDKIGDSNVPLQRIYTSAVREIRNLHPLGQGIQLIVVGSH
jgi:hypothetical protein